jgi:hypothetical protein
MDTVEEIQAAIAKLSREQIAELAVWMDGLHHRRLTPAALDSWLERARGAARLGITTNGIMDLTRDNPPLDPN